MTPFILTSTQSEARRESVLTQRGFGTIEMQANNGSYKNLLEEHLFHIFHAVFTQRPCHGDELCSSCCAWAAVTRARARA